MNFVKNCCNLNATFAVSSKILLKYRSIIDLRIEKPYRTVFVQPFSHNLCALLRENLSNFDTVDHSPVTTGGGGCLLLNLFVLDLWAKFDCCLFACRRVDRRGLEDAARPGSDDSASL